MEGEGPSTIWGCSELGALGQNLLGQPCSPAPSYPICNPRSLGCPTDLRGCGQSDQLRAEEAALRVDGSPASAQLLGGRERHRQLSQRLQRFQDTCATGVGIWKAGGFESQEREKGTPSIRQT